MLPSEILDELRTRIITELRQTGEMGESKDGMDISLIRMKLQQADKKGVTIQWAGANNPLYHIKKLDGNEKERDVADSMHYIQTIRPDKQAIGFAYNMQPFTNHEIKLQKGDIFILFSDGFADQFGGAKGKKLKYKPFKMQLLEAKDEPMQEQKEIIITQFNKWKGNLEQVDDVCVIGVRI